MGLNDRKYSVVIAVFNSEAIVAKTIARTRKFFEGENLDYELILVNDGSRDGSWEVIRRAALEPGGSVNALTESHVCKYMKNIAGASM